MAILCETGEISAPGSTGNQSYTFSGALNGRTPKFILFYTAVIPADVAAAAAHGEMIGWTTGSTAAQNVCHNISLTNNSGTGNCASGFSKAHCIWENNASALQHAAVLVSFDSDGFTLNWTNVTGGAGQVYQYAAFDWDGGESINVMAGSFDTGGATGSLGVTGVGFQPKLVLFLMSKPNNTDQTVSATLDAGVSLGAAVSSSNRWCRTYGHTDGAAPTNVWEESRNNRVALTYDDGGGQTPRNEIDFVSMDADGFTVDRITDDGTSTVGFLALGGAGLSVAIGTDAQKTSTGTQAKTGLGIQPQALILGGVGNTSANAQADGIESFFGVAASASDNRCIAGVDVHNVDPSDTGRYAATKCAAYITGTTPTVTAEADLSSFDADGYTLDWTTADATARLFGFAALRGAGGSSVPVKMASYRRRRAA